MIYLHKAVAVIYNLGVESYQKPNDGDEVGPRYIGLLDPLNVAVSPRF